MGRIILYIAVSLDGYIAREAGAVDWLPTNTDSGYGEFYKLIDTVIMGKKTYDQILTFGDYPYKEKKSFVFSRNNSKTKDENVEFTSNVEEFAKKFKPSLKENIWLIGGSDLLSAFLQHKLVDEIILSVIPIVLGSGISLFQNIHQEVKLELLKTTKYDGLVELCYKVLK
ncbi:MAG: dihydrofolate reductase [Nitrosopumilus sp.]|nr:MAG: dihydrofolate reductase [Nitrosopumilus sp.]